MVPRRDSFTPGQGFLHDTTNTHRPSASSSSSSASRNRSLTQAKLFGMHKAALITPRASLPASASASSSRSRVPPPRANSLVEAFGRQSQSMGSVSQMGHHDSRRRVERGEAEVGSTGSGDDEARRPNSSHQWREPSRRGRRDPPSSRHSETAFSGVGKKVLLQSRRDTSDTPHETTTASMSNSLARSILDPSTKRRGPRLSFDDDPHENDDDDERMMLGEEARRKKNRVWKGGRGQLDLVPMRDWKDDQARSEVERGWGTAAASAKGKGKGKKPLEMLGDDENVGIQHRVQESTQIRRDDPMSASLSEPDTENDDHLFPPTSARSKPRMVESQPSFADSSESDAGEYLQQRLVGGRAEEDLVPSSSDADILVCDSDEETVDRLTYQFGRGGVDDSGFAEYNDDEDDEKFGEEQGGVGMILPSSQPRSDEATLLEPEKRKGAMTLERSESSILMPPPPVPVRRQARDGSVLVSQANEVPPSRVKEEPSCEEIETQWALESPINTRPNTMHETLPNRRSTWSSLDAAWLGARPLTPPPPPEPRQANLFEFFPNTQKARGGEGDEDDEDWVIADSQPGSSIPLGHHQMRAFQAALITTSEMGRRKLRCGEGLGEIEKEQEEEIEEADEEVEGVEVPSSDQEDGPWSPLGSPVRMRFPRGGGGKEEVKVVQLEAEEEEEEERDVEPEGEVELEEDEEEQREGSIDLLPSLPSFLPSSQMSSTQRDRIKSRGGTIEMEEEEGGEREETQWESYWTLEAVEPSPFRALMDDDDEL